MDVPTTLAWLQAQSLHALQAARAGDAGPANRLAQHTALAHYFTNVASLRSLTPAQWAAEYPALLRAADRLRRDLAHHDAAAEQIAALNARLDRLLRVLDPGDEEVAVC